MGNINIYLPKNNALYISILSILILFAVIIYFNPKLFVFLFHSILGNITLFVILFLIAKIDMKLAFGLLFLFLIIYLSSNITLSKEGFELKNPWPQKTIDEFLEFQKDRNPNFQYDMSIVQQQASLDEVNELFKTGKWPWSDKVKDIYLKAIASKSIINIAPDASMENAQMIYNEMAIKQILSWNSKEGTFLLNGVIIGNTSGLPKNYNNTIQCGLDKDRNPIMQKKVYNGYNGIYGNMDETITTLKNSDLPKEITGFAFLKEECNPCVALNSPPDYSCPFSINTGNGPQVSDIWKMLWGNGAENLDEQMNQTKNFPLLTQLKKELNDADINHSILKYETKIDDEREKILASSIPKNH